MKTAIGKGRKLPPPEEGELSTMPGRRVRVHASGRIEVHKETLDSSDEEIVKELGVELELKQKNIPNEVVTKKKRKQDLEDKYIDNTSKRIEFEDEEAEAAEAKKQKQSKKKKNKMRKVKK